MSVLICCCLPTPSTRVSGGSHMVHQTAYASTWPAAAAGSTHKYSGGNVVRMWVQLKKMVCLVCVDVTEGA